MADVDVDGARARRDAARDARRAGSAMTQRAVSMVTALARGAELASAR